MKKDLIIKFLDNRCTNTEIDQVIQWVKEGASNYESKSWAFEDWNKSQGVDNLTSNEKFTTLFDKIQENINSRQLEIGERKLLLLPQLAVWLTRVAAIFLIPVLAFLFYTLSEKKMVSVKYADLAVDSLEIIAPIGSRTVVQLSDGSKVHLNYGSKLKHPQFFSRDTREVILEGEGFFEVAHNPETPFIVKTGKLNIKALGTAFNVLAYPGDDVIQTTLVDGKVVLKESTSLGSSKNIGSMIPGQHVSYHINTGEVSCIEGDTKKYIAWKDGELVFVDTPIVEVAERLSRMFNVDIEVTDDIKKYIYTVTFIDEPLYQILDLMAIATPVSYTLMQREKMEDGTYSKQKIIIKKKH